MKFKFKLGQRVKVSLSAKKVKPALLGETCIIIRLVDSLSVPAYEVTTLHDDKIKLFMEDELQSIYAYDIGLLR